MISNYIVTLKAKMYRSFCAFFLVGWIFSSTPSGLYAADSIPLIAWRDLSVGELIGHGSFGDVHRGTWRGQTVAIKILQMKILTPQLISDFNTETRLMWQCQFPNILRLFGICTEAGHCSMVFELMPKGSLYSFLHDHTTILSERYRCKIAADLAKGLMYLHDNGVVHRDLKSGNVLLSKSGAKISDFGLAKLRVVTSTAGTAASNRAVGTLRWRAPELFSIRPPKPSPSQDIYGFGMILWELVTRRAPFEDQPDDQIVLAAIKDGEREEIPADCPSLWKKIIESCWNKDPLKRPTAKQVFDQLMESQLTPMRALWLPEEEPDLSKIRANGYGRFYASFQDWKRVLECYAHHPVQGYDVGDVEVVYNPAMNASFKAKMSLLQKREGNPRYVRDWNEGGDIGNWRLEIANRLESLSEGYLNDDDPDVKMLPLWHGTQKDKLDSILSAGYSAFGDTDDGYFGKGIYVTGEASYAELYANSCRPIHNDNGVLILNWVIAYSSYPIISEDYDVSQKKLKIIIPAGRYDSHFVPVVKEPGSTVNYMPTIPKQTAEYNEFVFFDNAQVLPRYLVTLKPYDGSGMSQQSSLMFQSLRDKLQIDENNKRLILKNKLFDEYASVLLLNKEAEQKAKRQIEDPPAKRVEQPSRQSKDPQKVVQQVQSVEALVPIERPLAGGIPIPDIARGHEEDYHLFMRGRLVYRPDPKSDVGIITLPIANLINPLGGYPEGTFNLLGCGATGQYLSINAGYRKGKITDNANKVEIWFVPRFMVFNQNQQKFPTPPQFKDIEDQWTHQVGIFWTWGGWDSLSWYDYLTDARFDQSECIYEKWNHAHNLTAMARAMIVGRMFHNNTNLNPESFRNLRFCL